MHRALPKSVHREAFRSLRLVCGLALASLAAATPPSVAVRLRTIPRSEAVDGSVTLDCGQTSMKLTRQEIGSYEYRSALPVNSFGTCEFTVRGPEGQDYISRTIPITGARVVRQPVSRLQFFIMPKPAGFTWRYIRDGEASLGSTDADRAIGYFEPAYQALTSDNTEEYRLRATYGYANGLQRACLTLGYATCQPARRLYDSLLAVFSDHHWQAQYGLSLARLQKERGDTLDQERNSLYGQIPRLVQDADFVTAADLARRGIVELNQDPEGFRDVGLTRKRLLADAGDAYLKASLDAEAKGDMGKARELLLKADEQFAQLQRPDPTTAGNIALARSKIENLQQEVH